MKLSSNILILALAASLARPATAEGLTPAEQSADRPTAPRRRLITPISENPTPAATPTPLPVPIAPPGSFRLKAEGGGLPTIKVVPIVPPPPSVPQASGSVATSPPFQLDTRQQAQQTVRTSAPALANTSPLTVAYAFAEPAKFWTAGDPAGKVVSQTPVYRDGLTLALSWSAPQGASVWIALKASRSQHLGSGWLLTGSSAVGAVAMPLSRGNHAVPGPVFLEIISQGPDQSRTWSSPPFLLLKDGDSVESVAKASAAATSLKLEMTLPKFSFTRDLQLGSTGADVEALQNFLMVKGFLTLPAPGAGEETVGYFGSLTKAALAAWERQVGISPADGFFGPIARAMANAQTAGR
ncbi:MAG TPA: peptidoglycan-binding domain-containing protein [Candidatus Paceibacterota bacterium]